MKRVWSSESGWRRWAGFAAAALVLAFGLVGVAEARVPPPAETPCAVIQSGRTTTLKSIVIVPVGQEIPETYSTSVKNTPGMSWYVSQHYALKTDHDEGTARRYLTYSELAYPFHVWILGRHPADQDKKRMPLVMGTSYNKTIDAIQGDGGWRPGGIGGGITYWGMNTAYNYPSGTLQYHQRDLVMHENLHLMQMCCAAGYSPGPGRFLEGITHTSSNHVYNDEKNQLTMAVFDKATINNPTSAELQNIRKNYKTFREVCQANSHICLFTQFMWSDPERLMKWRIWRDEILWPGKDSKPDLETMEELFGPLDGRIEQDWKAWLDARHFTFQYRDWGWEQSGDTLWSYGFPQGGPYARTDILLPPGEKPEYDPLRMDYPLQPMSPLVGPVQRGVEEPSAGVLIDLSHNPGSDRGGMGLGVLVDKPTNEGAYLRLLIQQTNNFVIEGQPLGMPSETIPLPEDLRKAMLAGKKQIGLTAKIGKTALEVTLRAKDPAAKDPVEFKKSWPINAEQRERLLKNPGAVLSVGGNHRITPYFDDARRPDPDLNVPAPGNRWRFAGDLETYRLYRAIWRMNADAPDSLLDLAHLMVKAMDKAPQAQQAAIDAYACEFPQVLKDIRAVNTDKADRALAELAGVSMTVAFQEGATFLRPKLAAQITGPVDGEVTGTVQFVAEPDTTIQSPSAARDVYVKAEKIIRVPWQTRAISAGPSPFRIEARANLEWNGVRFTITDSAKAFSSIPRWRIIGPFDNKGGGTVDTPQDVEKEPVELSKKYTGKNGKPVGWTQCAQKPDAKVVSEHLVDFAGLYGGENVSAYALVWVESPEEQDAVLALGSGDGVVVWLNGERVHKNLVSRGYASMQDRVNVHLKKGVNLLMVKVLQGNGGWGFAAHLLDKSGRPLEGITYSLAAE